MYISADIKVLKQLIKYIKKNNEMVHKVIHSTMRQKYIFCDVKFKNLANVIILDDTPDICVSPVSRDTSAL